MGPMYRIYTILISDPLTGFEGSDIPWRHSVALYDVLEAGEEDDPAQGAGAGEPLTG